MPFKKYNLQSKTKSASEWSCIELSTMAEKAKEAELSEKMSKLPMSDNNEPPLSKAVGSAEKVIKVLLI